jgi:hypothetical protein
MKTVKWAIWDEHGIRGSRIRVNHISKFDARGMRRVYGRGDHYSRREVFNMDLWLTKDRRLLARFWSRSSWVDDASLEVTGFSPALPLPKKGVALDERWAAQCLRDEYDDWIDDEISDIPVPMREIWERMGVDGKC